MVGLIRGLLRFALMVLLSAVVALVVDVGSDSFSTEASASIGGLSVSSVPVAPRVVSAVAGDGFAQVTIADMSPDTGVYAVQWVSSGQDFNSYQMYRTTSKTMTVPYLACTRSYTFRVFVMAADWLVADGHQTQNVTPHSQTFDLTMPACRNAAPGVSALTCATGGTCIVGDTGPGGGKVFYVQAAGGTFTSTGSDCNTACKYLEAAPSDQSTGIAWATTTTKCYALDSTTDDQDCQLNSIYSGTGQAASRTAATAIGKGMANTNQIYTRLTTATYAAGIAWAYTNNGKTDWHLPSKDELNQLYTNRTTVGGFSTASYWSSSEFAANGAWGRSFSNGIQFANLKFGTLCVRPVRAFG